MEVKSWWTVIILTIHLNYGNGASKLMARAMWIIELVKFAESVEHQSFGCEFMELQCG